MGEPVCEPLQLLARFNPPLNGRLPRAAQQQLQKLLEGQQTVVVPLAHLTRFLGELSALLEDQPPEETTITLENRPSQGMVLVARCRDTKMSQRVVNPTFRRLTNN
jgi:hypothetical protein